MDEKCYKHPDQAAIKWREALILGEPDRVPLCNKCVLESRKLPIILYPMNERRMYDTNRI
jgi:hypothetical protein